jgi:hypothetical protein
VHLARIAGVSAVVFGCLVSGVSVSAAADRPNRAVVNAPNAPFDSVLRSVQLTDKTPATALIVLADANELTKAGEVLAVNVGDPSLIVDAPPTSSQTPATGSVPRSISEVRRTSVTLPLGSDPAQSDVWELGTWRSTERATVAAAGPDTVELELPKLAATNGPRFVWITTRAPGAQADVPVSPLFALDDLSSTNAGGFGASSAAWTSRGGALHVVTVPRGPQLSVSRASMRVTFDQDAPIRVGDQAVTEVVDVLQIRPHGEMGRAPFRLEIDEKKGTLTGYAGASSTPLTYTPPGTGRKDGPGGPQPVAPAPITYSTSIGKVAAGTRVEVPLPNIEQGLGVSLGDGTETAITRRVVLADGETLFFDGVSTSVNQEALLTTGTTPEKASSAGRLSFSKKTVAVAGAVLVALLIVGWSFWRWLRDTQWFRFLSERRKNADASS